MRHSVSKSLTNDHSTPSHPASGHSLHRTARVSRSGRLSHHLEQWSPVEFIRHHPTLPFVSLSLSFSCLSRAEDFPVYTLVLRDVIRTSVSEVLYAFFATLLSTDYRTSQSNVEHVQAGCTGRVELTFPMVAVGLGV